jgi:hypothetical protein
MSARPFAAGGRLAVPFVYIAAELGRVGQALPLLGDRVAQGVGGRLAVPSVCIAAEPGRVGQALPLLAAW